MPRLLLAALLISLALLPTSRPADAALGEQMPSFIEKGAVFCTDQLDFTAWQTTGLFHTRGGHDSCVVIDRLTRVALIDRGAPSQAEVRVVSGSHTFEIGWTNAPLPVIADP